MDIQELQLKVNNLAQESGLFQVSTLAKLQELEKDIKDINNNLLAVVRNLDSLTAKVMAQENYIDQLEKGAKEFKEQLTKPKDKWFNWF